MDAAAAAMEAAMLATTGGGSGGAPPADDASRRAAEGALMKLLAKPTCGGALYALLRGSAHVAVRQLAGVLLRKKVIAYWTRLPAGHKAELQAALLAALGAEPERLVRKAIVSVIAALAKVTLPGGGWPELTAVLTGCPASPTPGVRELGLVLVRELVEGLGPRLAELAPALKPVFAAGLADGDVAVRVAAVRALVPFLLQLEDADDVRQGRRAAKAYADLVPPLLGALQHAMTDGAHEAAAQAALEGLTELLEVRAKCLAPYTTDLTRYLAGVLGAGSAVDDAVRACAGHALVELLQAHPGHVAKAGLLASAVLPAVVACLLEFDADADEEAEREAREGGIDGDGGDGGGAAADAGGNQPWNVGAHVLDCAAQALPPKHVFAAMGGLLPPLLTDARDWRRRRAGLAMLAAAAQGCAEPYKAHLDSVLAAVCAGARDASSPHVRAAACWALAQFADHLQPRILNAHATVLPALFAALGGEGAGGASDPAAAAAAAAAHPLLIDRACMALEVYVEGLKPTILAGYLAPLLGRLGAILSAPSLPVWVHETVVTALASVAIGAEGLLVPYLPSLAPALLHMAGLNDARMLRMRAKATECLGHVAVAVGRDAFAPYMAPVMATVAAGFDLQVPEVDENSYAFFACAAQVVGPGLEPVLPALWARMKEALSNNDCVTVAYKDDDDDGGAAASGDLADRLLSGGGSGAGDDVEDSGAGRRRGGGGGAGDSDDSDDSDWDEGHEDLGRALDLRVRTSLMDVKCAAVNCLNQLAAHCGPCFGPLIPDALAVLETLSGYFHDDVRGYALQALRSVTLAAVALAPQPPASSPTSGGGSPAPLPAELATLVGETFTKLLDAVRCDPNKAVATAACRALAALVTGLGRVALWERHKAVMGALMAVLRERTACQAGAPEERPAAGRADGDDVDEEEDEEEAAGDADGDDEEDDGEDDEEDDAAAAGADADDDEDADDGHDQAVLEEAFDAVVAVARVMGGDAFAAYLPRAVAAALRHARPSRPHGDQVSALGFCTDLLNALAPHPSLAPHVAPIGAVVLRQLRQPSPELRRNAAFCTGILLQRCTGDVRACGLLAPLLEGLQATFARGGRGRGDDEDLVLDNAVSALARALTSVPDAVPAASAVPAIVAALPLVADHAETGVVLGTLLDAATQRQPQALEGLPAVLAAVGGALAPGSPVPRDDVTVVIVPALRRLAFSASDADKARITAAVGALPPAERAALQAALEARA